SDNYRAPVPLTLHGAQVLSTPRAHALWQDRTAIFIDVLPRPPRPEGLPPGTIWHPKPRFDIPGSIWLPDTGYGKLAPVMEAYFQKGLTAATGSDPARALVFYCLHHCWMSWNAAKRALSLGYSQVDWYPGGTDDWSASGFPLEHRRPIPRPSLTTGTSHHSS
ncbi:MAG: PQQ-dependent catabolism-associated CXXCW motif protein, partial [Acetobacteraceae bacterium]